MQCMHYIQSILLNFINKIKITSYMVTAERDIIRRKLFGPSGFKLTRKEKLLGYKTPNVEWHLQYAHFVPGGKEELARLRPYRDIAYLANYSETKPISIEHKLDGDKRHKTRLIERVRQEIKTRRDGDWGEQNDARYNGPIRCINQLVDISGIQGNFNIFKGMQTAFYQDWISPTYKNRNHFMNRMKDMDLQLLSEFLHTEDTLKMKVHNETDGNSGVNYKIKRKGPVIYATVMPAVLTQEV